MQETETTKLDPKMFQQFIHWIPEYMNRNKKWMDITHQLREYLMVST